MRNLAGNKNCDFFIKHELQEAGIYISSNHKSKGEVPYTIEGNFKHFKFRRAWIYWIVEGLMPLKIAKKIYVISKKLIPGNYNYPIRVNGHCGCPEPKENVYHFHIDTQEGLNTFVKIVSKEI